MAYAWEETGMMVRCGSTKSTPPLPEYEIGDNEDTGWHSLTSTEITERLTRLNSFLEERGFRTRFRVVRDEFGWDVIVDDGGKPDVVETVEEAECIVEELCGERAS